MKRKYRNLVIFCFTVLLSISCGKIYAIDSMEMNDTLGLIPRTRCEYIFEKAGIDVSMNAVFSIEYIATEDNRKYSVLCMTEQEGDVVSKTIAMNIMEDNDEINYLNIEPELFNEIYETQITEGTNKGNLYLKATYSRKVYGTGSIQSYYYKPLSCSFIASASYSTVELTYRIHGSAYTNGMVEVTDETKEYYDIYLKVNTPSNGATYSKTGSCVYWYKQQGVVGPEHRLYYQINGGVMQAITLEYLITA